jgi:hypothetical protein
MGKGSARRKANKSNEEAYRNNKFWDKKNTPDKVDSKDRESK